MRVTLIAHTTMVSDVAESRYDAEEWLPRNNQSNEPNQMNQVLEWCEDADFLSEFAGRSCYESWSRPNSKTRMNVDYINHILDLQHHSVLEHASATFYITGVSRSLTHELVRHRHLSFSQRSQRYVDESESEFVYPPALREELGDVGWALDHASGAIKTAYDDLMKYLTQTRGLPRKEARQAARCILPNMTSTSIVVTGNHRAWRDVLQKRWHVAADKEICELAGLILTELRGIAPNTYQDIPTQPFGSEK